MHERALLTSKQLTFANNMIAGMLTQEAYLDAYPASQTWKRTSVSNAAAKLLKRPMVAAYIADGIDKAKERAILTRQRALEILSKQAEGKVPSITKQTSHTAEGTIETVTEKFLVSDSKSAIDSLAKLENWNKEKSIIGEAEGIVLNFNLTPSKGNNQ